MTDTTLRSTFSIQSSLFRVAYSVFFVSVQIVPRICVGRASTTLYGITKMNVVTWEGGGGRGASVNMEPETQKCNYSSEAQ